MNREAQVTFLGTGTSHGVPMIGCHCRVCTSPDPHDKRTRASVVISYGNTRVLVDTTPELRIQSIAHCVDRIEAVVVSTNVGLLDNPAMGSKTWSALGPDPSTSYAPYRLFNIGNSRPGGGGNVARSWPRAWHRCVVEAPGVEPGSE